MSPWIWRIALFATVMTVSLVMTAPLAFMLQRADLDEVGIDWERAEGTIWNGRLEGVRFGRQPFGSLALKAEPASLLTGRLAYHLSWQGGAGTGSGYVSANRSGFSVSDLTATVPLAALSGLDPNLRNAGAFASVEGAKINFRNKACASAAGRVSTDLLEQIAEDYGETATILSGDLSCDDAMLQANMDGQLTDGAPVQLRLRGGWQEPSSIEADIRSENIALTALLVEYGFEQNGQGFSFRRETSLRRAL